MTETLKEIIKSTDIILAGEMKVPVPPLEMKRRLEALEGANLLRQRASLLLDMRAWQAEQLGFKQMTVREAVALLMGADPTHDNMNDEGRESFTIEYLYDHHRDVVETKWNTQMAEYWRMEKMGSWYVPPFLKKEVWRVRANVLDQLGRQIPYGALLKIDEAKSLKIFTSFTAVAPIEAWRSKSTEDPIILAGMSEIYKKDNGGMTGGREITFFLAQWQ